ncbi:enoyl-CoA hydratase/carnithine racemase [Rubricella aquisinus]|uniref:Enoyl-CoA hydratase/carnithine racemase n=1 Tax=Rubricella aquisinus TaxID=2028108 RepID=A0A840WKI3_9RHOB|nr:enoyl-CoA hydratase family protein [Rubricella aquisinus]MBB5514172.1 enoyl-CoA hydratase/carnithine racemase [Rubricella aquisinus]
MTLATRTRAGASLIVTNHNTARRNALSPDYYATLALALEDAASDPGIACLILTGAGDFFCAGGDLNLLRERRTLPEAERRARVDQLHDLIRGIRSCPKPVMAAVEGGAAGAGMSLAFAADLIVASREARFTAAYVKAGLTPDGGLTHALLTRLPRPMVAEALLFGTPIPAERLYALGAINRLCNPGDALATACALADTLATGAGGAQATIKSLMTSAAHTDPATHLDHERDAMAHAVTSPDGIEGIDAFLGKRPADFRKTRI